MLNTQMLKQKREKAGLTQSQAAEIAGVSRQRWNDIESGRKTNIELDTLAGLAKAIECDARELLICEQPNKRGKRAKI